MHIEHFFVDQQSWRAWHLWGQAAAGYSPHLLAAVTERQRQLEA
jgi:hypothetical protein